MKTCKLRPDVSACRACMEEADMFGYDVNCTVCSAFNKRYELLQVGIGTGFFGEDWAIIIVNGAPKRVPLSSVCDIKEE